MVTFNGYDVELSRGDTLALKIELDGRDLPEGTDGVFTIKKRINMDEVVLQKRFDASDEVLTVVLDADETNIDPGTYYWDVRLQIPLENGGYEVYTPMEYAAFVVLPVVGVDIGTDGSNMVNPDLPVLQVVLAEMRQAIQDANDATDKANEAANNIENGVNGKDGIGIERVEQTTTSTEDGGTNVITVTMTDGTSSVFEIRNGNAGTSGPQGPQGNAGKDAVIDTTLTQAGQAADAKATGDALSQLKDEKMQLVLLWENASPSSSFAPQTIPLDLNAYKYVVVESKKYVTGDPVISEICAVEQTTYIFCIVVADNYYKFDVSTRLINVNINGITFDSGRCCNAVDPPSEDNRYCVPLKIYGVKG